MEIKLNNTQLTIFIYIVSVLITAIVYFAYKDVVEDKQHLILYKIIFGIFFLFGMLSFIGTTLLVLLLMVLFFMFAVEYTKIFFLMIKNITFVLNKNNKL